MHIPLMLVILLSVTAQAIRQYPYYNYYQQYNPYGSHSYYGGFYNNQPSYNPYQYRQQQYQQQPQYQQQYQQQRRSSPVQEVVIYTLRSLSQLRDDSLAIVEFKRSGCPACDSVKPAFESLAKRYSQRIRFYVCSADEGCHGSGISGYPSFAIYRHGTESTSIRRVVGYDPTGLTSLVSQSLAHDPPHRQATQALRHQSSRSSNMVVSSQHISPVQAKPAEPTPTLFNTCMHQAYVSSVDENSLMGCSEELARQYLTATSNQKMNIFDQWQKYADRYKAMLIANDPAKSDCMRDAYTLLTTVQKLEECRGIASLWLKFLNRSFKQVEELVEPAESRVVAVSGLLAKLRMTQAQRPVAQAARNPVKRHEQLSIWNKPLNAPAACTTGA